MADNRQPSSTATDELTIDELAARLGMTVRNLREWRTLGLLPRARMRGRVGYYPPDVVERVERIQKLHSEGFTLELISRMLDAGGEAGDEVMRLAATLRAPAGEVTGDPAERIARIAASLQELGLDLGEIEAATAQIRAHLDQIAEIFEGVWRETIWEPFVEAGMPEDELPGIQAAATRVKPLALDAVATLFTIAMDAQIESGIARELGRAATDPLP